MNATILRKHPKSGYTTISNDLLSVEGMSHRAIGLALRLLSKQDNWVIRIDYLAKMGKEGKQAVRKALQELATYGFLMRERIYENGKIKTITHIADYPTFLDCGTAEERINGYKTKSVNKPVLDIPVSDRSGIQQVTNGDLLVSPDLPIPDLTIPEEAELINLPAAAAATVQSPPTIPATAPLTATAAPPPSSAAPPPPAKSSKKKALPAAVVDKGLKLLTHEEVGLPETEALKLIDYAGGNMARLLRHVGGYLMDKANGSPYATHAGLFSRVQKKFNEMPLEKLPFHVTSNPVFVGLWEMPQPKYNVDPREFDSGRPIYSVPRS